MRCTTVLLMGCCRSSLHVRLVAVLLQDLLPRDNL
jgi:hypothetical protein